MASYKKDFKGIESAASFLMADGVPGGKILNGMFKAPGSKFDGLEVTEKNVLKAVDHTGYELPKTDLSKYMKVASGPTNRGRPGPNGRQFDTGDTMPPFNKPRNPDLPFPPVIRRGIDPTYPNNMPDMTVQNRNRPNNMAMNRGPAGGAGMGNGMNKNMLVKLATMQRLGLLG